MNNKILIIKNVESEGAGTLESFFKEKDFVTVVLEPAKGAIFPKNARDYKAVLIMGGPMNVYEESRYPFLKEEDLFIKGILKDKIPFLGICLEAQLLAKALAAKVVKSPLKEVGWYDITLTKEGKNDLLFKDIPEKLNVFQWHGDMFEIPKKGVLLASSAPGINQAFKYGENAYGFQFHIEVTPKMIESWLKNELSENECSAIMLESHKNKAEYERRAHIIYKNFLKLTHPPAQIS